ncbi:MAG: hypothetical protein ACYC2T_02030 [Bacillota bacterium]
MSGFEKQIAVGPRSYGGLSSGLSASMGHLARAVSPLGFSIVITVKVVILDMLIINS